MTNIQIRKVKGNWAEDIRVIDVRLNFDDDKGKVVSVLHTVSCPRGTLTHGGGAPSEQYLHYKSVDVDADADGDIDYSDTRIHVGMMGHGEYELTVKAKVTYELETPRMIPNPILETEAFLNATLDKTAEIPAEIEISSEEVEVSSNVLVLYRPHEESGWV